MHSEESVKTMSLTPPDSFPFPFPPYSIQEEFMKNLYLALEERKLGIFESPTGTGKSMSIICGALCWLQDHESQKIAALESQIEELEQQNKNIQTDQNGGDWITHQAKSAEFIHSKWIFQQKLNKLKEYNQKMEEMKKHINKIREAEKRKYAGKNRSNQEDIKVKGGHNEISNGKDYQITNTEDDEDSDILLNDSDLHCLEESKKETCDSDGEDTDKEDNKCTKVIVCSRTHSQLSQFIREVERSPYNNLRVIPLASRQSYCVNSTVRKLKSLTLMNERCTDLQRRGKGKSTKTNSDGKTAKKSKILSSCPYLQSQQAIQQLSEEALTSVQDVESLVTRGTQLHACPYYGTRRAVADAQVVVAPYNILLHKSTREACGLSLRDNVVVIDEAHNLLDTIANVYSAHVTGNQLIQAHSQLKQYLAKYEKLFSAMNVLYLTQLIFVTGNLIKLLGGKPVYKSVTNNQKTEEDTKLYTLPDFVTAAEIDNINLYRLLAFCKTSKVANKLQGFSARHPSVEISSKPRSKTGIHSFLKEISKQNVPTSDTDIQDKNKIEENGNTNSLLPLIAFLESLVNPCEDGRIVCNRQSLTGKGSLKFLLLNPASHFAEIVREARSVIVAGGTMQPMSEFRDQLFVSAGASLSQIAEFSCGHIIPPGNILPVVCTKDFLGNTFDFSYTKRNTVAMLNSLEKLLLTACNIVPGGIVCFFPSYDYEATVFMHLEKSNVIEKMSVKKKIFREPKNSSHVDDVLSKFSKAVEKGKTAKNRINGAFLFSVVGGKLSEGLNFSDDLGRCIIVVGLPYPNITSPELQEKIHYLNTHVSPDAGQQHYENLCMKAVNQCIGRAVRHKHDYASVLLVDHRYAKPCIQKLLPQWILSSLRTDTSACQDSFGWIVKFFAAKKKASCSA